VKRPRVLLFGVCALSLSLGPGCSRGSNQADLDPDAAGGTTTTTAGSASAQAGASGGSGMAGTGVSGNLPPLPNDTQSGVFVHLFEWRWPDIAQECENFLGPKGFTAVQVSPPSEHALLPSYAFPWWQRYQTVGYQLQSRSGTREEFVDMVSRCRAAGVGIYVDAVLNHTTAQATGTGSAGTKFTKYGYPDLFTQADFHSPVCQIQDTDYTTSAEHVQRCELVSLADLDTGNPTVQAKLARYLSDLLQIGVRGFRLDAAKHMAAADLAGILALVTPRADEKPYYFLEVIDYGGEAVHASDYLDVAPSAELDVTEFKYKLVGDAFLGRSAKNIAGLGKLTMQAWLASERAVAFVNNHDTQRGDAVFYQDGPAHDLANVFMLAWPYGYPSVMSSYGFDRASGAGRDVGPPSDGGGSTHPVYEAGATEPSCVVGPYTSTSKGWICEHRARGVANMVAFRKATASAVVANWWDNGQNQLAFSRGDRGFVAINHESGTLTQTLPTGLAAGSYCDVLSGDFTPVAGATPASCTGTVVEVDATGSVSLQLTTETALAIHTNAKL
jgi:alpha-amylase